MREIKFRAWDLDEKKMYLIDKLTTEEWVTYTSKHVTGKGNTVFQQYTCLKDKNGIEIYEGDVVKDCSHTGGIFKIEWCDDLIGYYAPVDWVEEEYLSLGLMDVEIIGNIYENPDLLANHTEY